MARTPQDKRNAGSGTKRAQKARLRETAQTGPKIKIKKDDEVKVIAGRDRGKTGRVLAVDHKKGKVLVEGVSMVKRHTRPNPQQQIKGGIAERESAISVSNVMAMTSGGVATRVGFKIEGEGVSARRVRIARKSGEPLDRKG